VDIDVIEKDGFFDILYALNDPGDYDINVKFGGKDIPNGSFSIKVAWTTFSFETLDLTKPKKTDTAKSSLVTNGNCWKLAIILKFIYI